MRNMDIHMLPSQHDIERWQRWKAFWNELHSDQKHAFGGGWYLEATVEDLHSLLAPQGHVHGDLLVTADTE